VDELADLEHARLLESPGRQLVRELAVGCLDALTGQLGALGKVLVLEKLGRSDNHQTRGVVGLHGRDQVQLLADRERVLNCIRLILGIVAVCGAGGTENRCQKRRVVSEHLAHGTRYRNVAIASKVVLDV